MRGMQAISPYLEAKPRREFGEDFNSVRIALKQQALNFINGSETSILHAFPDCFDHRCGMRSGWFKTYFREYIGNRPRISASIEQHRRPLMSSLAHRQETTLDLLIACSSLLGHHC
jgi:hypothetical protein